MSAAEHTTDPFLCGQMRSTSTYVIVSRDAIENGVEVKDARERRDDRLKTHSLSFREVERNKRYPETPMRQRR